MAWRRVHPGKRPHGSSDPSRWAHLKNPRPLRNLTASIKICIRYKLPAKNRFTVSSTIPSQKFAHAGNYLRDANRTVEDVSGIWKGNFYGARGYHDGREAVHQILDPNVPEKFW